MTMIPEEVILSNEMLPPSEVLTDDSFILVNDYDYLTGVFQAAIDSSANNLDYFIDNKSRQYSLKFMNLFQSILDTLSPLQISVDMVAEKCSTYDSRQCKGNGYRSIISVVDSCLKKIIAKSELIRKNREKIFFQLQQQHTKLAAYAQVLTRLLKIVQFAIILMNNSEEDCLFPKDSPEAVTVVNGVLGDFNNVNRECFYGSCFGFQYPQSVKQAFRIIIIAMAAYGDGFDRHKDILSRAVSSVLHSGKYIMDPLLRAKRITELTQVVDIKFCKAFWSLTDEYGVQYAPVLICPTMAVNVEFTIPSDGIVLKTNGGSEITIDLPLCNAEQKGVKARLLSFEKMDGQISNVLKNSEAYDSDSLGSKTRSRYLMLHCHGGGFVAQSSKSHEIYLRHWAKELRFPILSIDYSLFPEASFPQALNEIFFAYVWALENCEKLGFTGEKIVVCGDSAGANLVTALTLKLIKSSLRIPDSIVIAYPPFRAQYYPSPSRILCLMDPLLPIGVLKACLQAYSGDLNIEETYVSSPSSQSDLFPSERVLERNQSFSDSNLATRTFTSPAVHRDADEEEYFSDSASSYLVQNTRYLSNTDKNEKGKRKFSLSKDCFFPYVKCKSKGTESVGELELDRVSLNEDVNPETSCTSTNTRMECHSSDVIENETDNEEDANTHSVTSPIMSCCDVEPKENIEVCISSNDQESEKKDTSENLASDYRNPLMSPIFASDELLKKMPPISIFACALDPLFDDSVEFIRKLEGLGKDAKLIVLDNLPHGFLNLQLVSLEARAACKKMVECIKKSLDTIVS